MNLHLVWEFVAVSTGSVSEGATNKTLSLNNHASQSLDMPGYLKQIVI